MKEYTIKINGSKKMDDGCKFCKFCIFLLLLASFQMKAQVKIGDSPDTIDTASILELESSSRALILTRITSLEMEAILPLEGAIVYNTTDQCIYYYNGGEWNNLCDGSGSLSFVNNEDGTFTITASGQEPITFNAAPETVTTLVDNENGTYTYTNEDGSTTLITSSGGSLTGTPGSVFFADSQTGALTEDNENLFWDNENKRLGIKTSTPTNDLEVDGLIRTGRMQAGAGTVGFPGFHFTNNSDSGMFGIVPDKIALSADGQETIRITSQRVGIKVTNPQATLHVGGNLIVDGSITGTISATAKSSRNTPAIRRVSENRTALTEEDHTLILEGSVSLLDLPLADQVTTGHVFIIKDLGGLPTRFSIPFRNFSNKRTYNTQEAGVLWLQSDGIEWQQIN